MDERGQGRQVVQMSVVLTVFLIISTVGLDLMNAISEQAAAGGPYTTTKPATPIMGDWIVLMAILLVLMMAITTVTGHLHESSVAGSDRQRSPVEQVKKEYIEDPDMTLIELEEKLEDPVREEYFDE